MKQNKPLISVVMSTYNSDKYIFEAIKSILEQTFQNFEFIIVNDGSTDNTLGMIKKFEKLDKRIKVINNIENLGLIKSLNKGLRKARGNYIARMDADDISLPERLKIQYNYLERHSDIFLVGASFEYINESGEVLFQKINNYSPKLIEKKLAKKSMIHHPTVLFRNVPGIIYREKAVYCEDRDLWLRFLSEGKKMIVLPNIVLKYRLNMNSICISNPIKQRLFIKEVVKWYRQRLVGDVEDYDRFDPKQIKSIKEDNEAIEFYNSVLMLELYFKHGKDIKIFRKNLLSHFKKFVVFKWTPGIILFIISLTPNIVISVLRKAVIR